MHAAFRAAILLCALAVSPIVAAADMAGSHYLDAVLYEKLTSVSSPTRASADIRRWHDPSVDPKNYKAVIFEPLRYHPADPIPNDKVSQRLLDQLPGEVTRAMRREVSKVARLTDKPGPGVLRFESAIVGVATENQGLQLREVLPVALVIAGAKLAAGARAQEAYVQWEWKLTDSQTGQLLAAGARKGAGELIKTKGDKVTLENLRPAIKAWAEDAGQDFARLNLPR